MNWVIFACYFYACAGISSKTTVLLLLLSLFSPSLMHAVCPAALTAEAATTAIDNKRRAPSTSPSSLALSPSSFVTFHVSFYEWRQRRRSRRKQTTKKHKAHFYICKINERRDECGARNETKSSKIHKNQMTKIKSAFTLLSLSLSPSLSLASSCSPSPSGCLCSSTRHDDSQFHSFMIHESASSRFHIFSPLFLLLLLGIPDDVVVK